MVNFITAHSLGYSFFNELYMAAKGRHPNYGQEHVREQLNTSEMQACMTNMKATVQFMEQLEHSQNNSK